LNDLTRSLRSTTPSSYGSLTSAHQIELEEKIKEFKETERAFLIKKADKVVDEGSHFLGSMPTHGRSIKDPIWRGCAGPLKQTESAVLQNNPLNVLRSGRSCKISTIKNVFKKASTVKKMSTIKNVRRGRGDDKE
jgi:hypothetical protein